MYSDITDIWLRYSVKRIHVKCTFINYSPTEPFWSAVYPYRAETSGINDVTSVESLPLSSVAVTHAYTKAQVIERTYSSKQIY